MEQGALPDFLRPRFIPVSPCMVRHNNLTFSEREREAWRNGDHMLAHAIAALETIETVGDGRDYDIAAGFPGEDCLGDLQIEILKVIPKKYHAAVMALLDTTQQELCESGNYGMECLNTLLADLS